MIDVERSSVRVSSGAWRQDGSRAWRMGLAAVNGFTSRLQAVADVWGVQQRHSRVNSVAYVTFSCICDMHGWL